MLIIKLTLTHVLENNGRLSGLPSVEICESWFVDLVGVDPRILDNFFDGMYHACTVRNETVNKP